MTALRTFLLAWIAMTTSITLTWTLFPFVSYANPGPGSGNDDFDNDDDDDFDNDDDDDFDNDDDDDFDIDDDDEPDEDIDDDEPDDDELDDDEPDDDLDEGGVEDDEPDEIEDDNSGSGSGDDEEPDEPEEDNSGSGSGDDDEPDEPEEDNSGPGSGGDDEPEEPEEDNSGPGSGGDDEPDEPEEDNSGPGSGGDDEPDEPEEDNSGPGSGGDDEPDEPEEDNSGPGSSGDDEPDEPDEDNSGPGSGGDDEPDEPEEGNSGSGSGDEGIEEDNSGPGSGDGDGDGDGDNEDEIEEDNSGSGSSGDDGDDEEDNSGPGSGDDENEDEDDNSGSNSGGDDDGDDDNGGSGSENSGKGSGDDDDDNSGPGSHNSGKGSGDDDDDGNSGSENENRGEGSNEQSAESFAARQDDDDNFAILGEWLVLVDPYELSNLSSRGYSAREINYLAGLDKMLARIEAPAGYNLGRVQRDMAEFSPTTQIDYNHLYGTKSGSGEVAGNGVEPRAVLDTAAFDLGANLKIGMIDTSIRTDHGAFTNAHLTTRDFVSYNFKRPKHGTSVASILIGETDTYRGLLPKAELYAASVFFNAPTGGEKATTENLVQALDWMVKNEVKVINMSLAGPSNAVLNAAIKNAQAHGAIIVAAVGNDGPAAKPLYPAAYPDVIAVTAVNNRNNIYRLANRGPHIDFSAPGVAIRNAAANNTFKASSGTSFASPFAAVILAVSTATYDKSSQDIITQLQENALDLGVAGFDPIYGYGLIKPLPIPPQDE
jgi:hypothetical protein